MSKQSSKRTDKDMHHSNDMRDSHSTVRGSKVSVKERTSEKKTVSKLSSKQDAVMRSVSPLQKMKPSSKKMP